MAPKVNKEKGVASSSHGTKRSRETREAPIEDAIIPQQPPWSYGLHRVMEQEDHGMTQRVRCDEHEGARGYTCPALSINEHNACIDTVLKHLYDMQMLHLRMSRVTKEKLQ
ncbi:hypothetical protein HAX54_022408 [Datura stramonium]|uniref:Uncharacterized protein n=1 Tax=Datura stramonium TaxID=4076 RepID=A0ABS8RKD7_DATST|nr:hypothetical protein [Datura stramonium]